MAETDPNKPPNLTDAQWNAMMLAQPPRPTIPTRATTIPQPQPATISGPTPPPAMPIGAIPAATIPNLAQPTPKESRAAGKEEFERGMPTVTAAPGTPQYGEERQQVADYKQAHPLGADVSAKPGFWGKLEHGLAKAGNIAGEILAPDVTALIPGSDLNKQLQAKGNAAWTRLGSETELQNAQTEKAKADVPLEQAETWKDLNPQAAKPGNPEEQVYAAEIAAGKSPEEALAAATKKAPAEGKSAADQLYAAEVAAGKSPEEAFAATQKVPTPNEEEKAIGDYLQGRNLPDTPANRTKARAALKALEQTPERPPHQLMIGPDGRAIDVRPGMVVPKGTKTASETGAAEKPTADEQRRADLAENLTENLDALEDIVKRRPELFGPLAGRWADLKQKFGSDDPDLAQLQVIEHQIGMAQISAHGMRSAQGVQAAADSIMNNLHNGPGAVLAGTQAVRHSIKTFTEDVDKKTGKTEETPQAGGGHSFTYNGQRYENVPNALYQKYKSKPGFKEE